MIGDNEPLRIMAWPGKWHMYLHEVPFLIYMDCYDLHNYESEAPLNRRPAQLAGQLAQYKFEIQFQTGCEGPQPRVGLGFNRVLYAL